MKLRNRAPLVCFLSLLIALTGSAAAQVSTVTPVVPDGWLIGPFGIPPVVDFVDGPGTPPFGVGSYSAEISDPGSKIILGRNDYHDLPFSSLTALSFWTFVDPAATNTNNWYVNLYLDADGDGSYETRLDYVPPPAQVAQGSWQFWDAFLGDWIVNPGGATTTLADFLTANPDARFNAFDIPEALALRFNMGDTANSYVGFLGSLDGVRVAVTGVGDTTWDFERLLPIVTVPTLSPLALSLLALLLTILGIGALRRVQRG